MPDGAVVNSWGGATGRCWVALLWAGAGGLACAGDDAPAGGTSGAATRGGGATASDGLVSTRGTDADADGDTTSSMATTQGDAPVSTTDGDTGDTGDTGESTGDSGVPSPCGNGMLDDGEGCDEPNGEEADGCNEDCTVSGAILWSHVQTSSFGSAEDLHGIGLDAGGNAYVAGSVQIGESSGRDYWVRQYTADGGLGWTDSRAGTAAGNDAALDLTVSGDEIIVAGFLNQAGASNNWQLGAYSFAGAQLWSAGYGNPIGGSDVAAAVAVDGTGAAYVAGYQAVFEQSQNIFIRQYLSGGDVGWEASVGGFGDQRAFAVAVDQEGNVIAGGFESQNGQGRNGWIRKYSPTGTALWTHTYVGAAALDDQVLGLATDAQGDIVAVGTEGTAEQGTIAFARRLGPDGAEQWTQTWEGKTAEPVVALDVAIDDVGHIVMVGTQHLGGISLGMVRKYDDRGALRWSQTYTTDAMTHQFVRAVTTAPDHRIWIAGGRDLGIDGRDAWIARIAQ